MKVAIVCFSLLGSSRTYAGWLQEELGADLLRFREAKLSRLEPCDAVIVCSGTFGGWMPLAGFLKKRWPVLSTKRVIAFAVGSVPPEAPPSQKAYQSIPPEIRKSITFFKLPCHSGWKLWLTGPFSAYQLRKHGESRGWKASRDQIAPILEAVRAGG